MITSYQKYKHFPLALIDFENVNVELEMTGTLTHYQQIVGAVAKMNRCTLKLNNFLYINIFILFACTQQVSCILTKILSVVIRMVSIVG